METSLLKNNGEKSIRAKTKNKLTVSYETIGTKEENQEILDRVFDRIFDEVQRRREGRKGILTSIDTI